MRYCEKMEKSFKKSLEKRFLNDFLKTKKEIQKRNFKYFLEF